MADKKHPGSGHHHDGQEVEKSDLDKLMDYAKANPSHVIIGVVAIAACVLLGIMINVGKEVEFQENTTEYIKALRTEEPAERVAELEEVAEENGAWSAEALYMMGETAIEARDYAKAKEAFAQVREQHADSSFTPRAVEGLAWIEENDGNYEAALKGYQEVMDKWKQSFIRRVQPFNIGRVQEALDNPQAAIDAYKMQIEIFEDSGVAMQAQQALTRLYEEHPELAPKEEAPAEVVDEESGAPVDDAQSEEAAPAEDEAAPAEETAEEAADDDWDDLPVGTMSQQQVL